MSRSICKTGHALVAYESPTALWDALNSVAFGPCAALFLRDHPLWFVHLAAHATLRTEAIAHASDRDACIPCSRTRRFAVY